MSYFHGTTITNAPDELKEYILCSKFGWTLSELYEQPYDKVQKFFDIINIQAQVESSSSK